MRISFRSNEVSRLPNTNTDILLKQFLHSYDHFVSPKKARRFARRGEPQRANDDELLHATNCLAKATSMLSPPWFSTSRPESGMSPLVD